MPTELSQVLDAIGGLKANVTNLTEGVKEQGDKIDAMVIDLTQVKTNCVGHLQRTDGLHLTVFGENGTMGLVKTVVLNGGRLDRLEDESKEKRAIAWKIAIPVIVAGVLAICGAAWALWNKMQ
jgi:hypothetical protein